MPARVGMVAAVIALTLPAGGCTHIQSVHQPDMPDGTITTVVAPARMSAGEFVTS